MMQGTSEEPGAKPERPLEERRLIYALIPPAVAIVLLWSVYLLDITYELDLFRFGILPREWKGLWGVLAAPFLHGDFDHLINNSIPIVVLGCALLYFFPRLAGRVVLVSWIISGLLVWMTARSNYHIGASGVVYGLAAFLFTSGLLRKQRTLMGLSMLVVFLYGSLLWGVFPILPRISWESHFWGAAAGVIMAIMYKHVPSAIRDPRPIVWDEEDEELEADPEPDAAQLMARQNGPEGWHSTDTWNLMAPDKQKPRPPEG